MLEAPYASAAQSLSSLPLSPSSAPLPAPPSASASSSSLLAAPDVDPLRDSNQQQAAVAAMQQRVSFSSSAQQPVTDVSQQWQQQQQQGVRPNSEAEMSDASQLLTSWTDTVLVTPVPPSMPSPSPPSSPLPHGHLLAPPPPRALLPAASHVEVLDGTPDGSYGCDSEDNGGGRDLPQSERCGEHLARFFCHCCVHCHGTDDQNLFARHLVQSHCSVLCYSVRGSSSPVLPPRTASCLMPAAHCSHAPHRLPACDILPVLNLLLDSARPMAEAASIRLSVTVRSDGDAGWPDSEAGTTAGMRPHSGWQAAEGAASPGPLLVAARSEDLLLVLRPAIDAALLMAPPQGWVHVECTGAGGLGGGEGVCITVEDSGPGLSFLVGSRDGMGGLHHLRGLGQCH